MKWFIHSVFCLTTGPKPPPKQFHHIARSRASSCNWEYPLLSLRSSSSFLHLLPRLLFTSISPFVFPSITCFRRPFLRKMWPIHEVNPQKNMARYLEGKTLFVYPMSHEGIKYMHGLNQTKEKRDYCDCNHYCTISFHWSVNSHAHEFPNNKSTVKHCGKIRCKVYYTILLQGLSTFYWHHLITSVYHHFSTL